MKKVITLSLSAILAASMICSAAYAEPAEDAAEAEVIETFEETADEAIGDDFASSGTPTLLNADEVIIDVPVSENGDCEIDYSVIEVSAANIAVSDDEVEVYMNSITSAGTTTETVTEGTVQNGDTVNIDFSGKLEGEEEPFDGGTAAGYDIVLGSGTFIPGFEEQVEGHEIGETFDITVTFPDEYTEELAGKNAVFTITINYVTVTIVPELNDEYVQTFSAENLDQPLNSVEELRQYTYDYLYNQRLESSVMESLLSKGKVISYNKDSLEIVKAYVVEDINAAASMYGVDADLMAMMYGFETASDYVTTQTLSYMDIITILDKIAADKGIEVKDEDIDSALNSYMLQYGYTGTVEEFREIVGEGFVFLISKLSVEYIQVVEAIKDNVVIVEDADVSGNAAEETVE
ncbi:MAG: FKBP-type peptidyl-prolyl cis-trans isomerase [Parasporobacterium sp.]|nr:FKBP-type peptidyl-prolyl cis-trans isomerase [Parasporobacterium sp.]